MCKSKYEFKEYFMLEVIENILVYTFKYFWVILIAMLLFSIVFFGIAGAINKRRLVKKEREKGKILLLCFKSCKCTERGY